MKQDVTFILFNAVILIGLVSGINESGRKTKIPYEPDRRIPIHVPDGAEVVPDDWNRLDSGKYSRSIKNENGGGLRRNNFRQGPDSVPSNSSDVCFTKDCVLAAASLLSSMDERVNPCENFYEFVCGSYIDQAIIPEHSGVHSTLGEISQQNGYRIHKLLTMPKENITPDEQQLRDFYLSCLDVETMEKRKYQPLFSALGSIGLENPMLTGNSVRTEKQTPQNLTVTILTNFLADSPLLGLDYSRDFDASATTNLLTLYQPRMRLPPALYHKEHPSFWQVMKFYERFYIAAASELRNNVEGLNLSDSELVRNVINLMGVEIELGRILSASTTIEDSMNKMTLAEFEQLLGSRNDSKIDLVGVIKTVIKTLVKIDIDDNFKMIVLNTEYFKKLYEVLDKFSNEDLVNYLTFEKILTMASSTTEYMRSLNAELAAIFSGVKADPPRWSTCVHQAITYFGAKVSQLFVEDRNGFETKAETEKMIVELRSAFDEIIRTENDWMDEETRTKALEKLEKITAVDVVYNDQLTTEAVSKVYQNLSDISEGTFLENIFSLQGFWTVKEISRIIETPRNIGDIDVMGFDSTLVNAMYSPEMNSIWLPNGIQQREVFGKNRISALNYGPLGSIVGHELTHGFDNTGAQFDKTGNFKNWWTNETLEAFRSKQECFINQYNSFEYPMLKQIPGYQGPTHVNGQQTLGENIADNGGFRESLRAYKKKFGLNGEASLPGLSKYTSNQLFFMSNARVWCETRTVGALISQLMSDPHPPARVRVQAVMSNSPDFQEAFQCSNDDPMVAKPRCKIW